MVVAQLTVNTAEMTKTRFELLHLICGIGDATVECSAGAKQKVAISCAASRTCSQDQDFIYTLSGQQLSQQ
jgi:hypothetical protein